MKLYSISFTAVVMALLWVSLNLPDPGNNVNPISRVAGTVRSSKSLFSPAIRPLVGFSGTYTGTGYYSYGPYNIDVSGLATGATFSLRLEAYDVPNRFTLNNGSVSTSTNWLGTATWPGPWGFSGVNNRNTGTISITKGSSNTIQLTVETSNENSSNHLNDSWYAWY